MKRKTRYKSHASESKPVQAPEPVVPEPVLEPVPEPVPLEPEFKGALQPMNLKPTVRWYTYEGLY